ncbi:cell wall metabolism sensor histidine kinase WalK [Salinibacterium sp. NK8237]|uniref:sensor histidine kinase n=1 Tax=Salinibacterium sp. NK8237 TaxID=2792038 RepID=UPI0018CCAB08|nr:ATP-binding protein [Salinibacterium sp. NK8237]MBH0130760.1 HAMP domain-containing protein [Salinibacterium sp. NK8237]
MRRLPLRWMLLLPILATIIVGFLAFAFAVDISERSHRLAELDAELTRAELIVARPPATTPDGVDAPAAPDGTEAPPIPPVDEAPATNNDADPADALESTDAALPVQFAVSADGVMHDSDGGENPFSDAATSSFAGTQARTIINVESYRVLLAPDSDGLVHVTALSLDSYNAAIASLRSTLVLGGIIIALLEAAVAWFLARQLTRPLATVTEGVTRIANGALDTPITAAGGSREISELSADLDRMVNRLREALAEREQSTTDATRARNDMRRLLADVAHEFRTPLTALKGYSDLYAQQMLTAPGALDRAMSRVGDESIRLNTLVSSMIQLARDGKPVEAVRVEVDLAEVALNVVDDVRVAFPEREIAAELAAATALGVAGSARLVGNPAQLHQALLNLVANACRHTPANTPIEVVASATDTEAIISVVDHGPGVAEEERDKIFQPFYRSDPSRVRHSHDGAGLGLAVTLEIAVQHGGAVSLKETPGGGATFELWLPLVSGVSASTPTS